MAAPEKNYLAPAGEIIGFDFLLNRFNHQFSGTSDYDVSVGSIRRNLHGPWVVDNDPFKTNQFGHPYQGSMYHGFARSAGLSYWEAAAYTFAGSASGRSPGSRRRPHATTRLPAASPAASSASRCSEWPGCS